MTADFSALPLITSRQNTVVVRAAKLRQKKYRDAEGVFLADGCKLLLEALEAKVEIVRIYLCVDTCQALPSSVTEAVCGEFCGCSVLLSAECFEKISPEKAPQGVIAEIKYLDKWKQFTTIYDMAFSPEEQILLLDNLQDPGNLGTVFRSAAAFGIDRVILGGACADPAGDKAIRASMGASFRLSLDIVNDTVAAVGALLRTGRRVYAAALDRAATGLPALSLSRGDVFLIGNEGGGLSPDLIGACTGSVYIPMTGKTESLNAAVAASVCLWQRYITVK